jgi:tetratricopeptide (TPR) repeat protein
VTNDEIVHIKPYLAVSRVAGAPLVQQPWFMAMQAIPFVAWLSAFIVRRRNDALTNNPRLRRQREVARKIDQGLLDLNRHAAGQDSDQFFATVFRLLQEQLGARLDLPASAITEAVIDERLRGTNLSDETLTALSDLFHLCNQARYAAQRTSHELAAIIPRVETTLKELEETEARTNRTLPGVVGLMVLILSTFSLGAAPQDSASAFEQANKLYEQGNFKEAAGAYEALIGRGVESPAIYFNLGNAWYKAGQNGRAIAAYLHAERLSPRDPNVRFNLGFVRNKINEGQISTGTFLQRALRRLNVNEWTIAASTALWVWLVLLAAREFRPAWRFNLRGSIMTAGIVTAVLAGALGAALYDRSEIKPGVVIVPEAAVHYGPLDESHTFYTLRDGVEIRVLENQPQNPWVKIEDGNGRQGWLKRAQVVTVFSKTPKSAA